VEEGSSKNSEPHERPKNGRQVWRVAFKQVRSGYSRPIRGDGAVVNALYSGGQPPKTVHTHATSSGAVVGIQGHVVMSQIRCEYGIGAFSLVQIHRDREKRLAQHLDSLLLVTLRASCASPDHGHPVVKDVDPPGIKRDTCTAHGRKQPAPVGSQP